MRRRGGWSEILGRADDEVIAALDSLAALLQAGARPARRPSSAGRAAALHRRAWALGLRVALAEEDAVLLAPELRREAERIARLWSELDPERAPGRPARADEVSPADLVAEVDDLRRRLGELQDGVVAPARRRRAAR